MNLWVLMGLFIVLPLLELSVLMQVHDWLGLGRTLFLVFFTGVVGATAARAQGISVIRRIQQDMVLGNLPAPGMIEGVMVLAAGLMLMTPGLITDAAGFLLLVPAVRAALRGWLRARFEKAIRVQTLRR